MLPCEHYKFPQESFYNAIMETVHSVFRSGITLDLLRIIKSKINQLQAEILGSQCLRACKHNNVYI